MFVFTASVKTFSGGNPDRNGKMPIVLQPISGMSPRGLNVLSGTVAENQGFVAGSVHAVVATEREEFEGTRQFNFSSVGVITPLEAIADAKENKLQLVIQPTTGVPANANPVNATP